MSVNNVRAFVVYMPLLIHRKKCTLIKNADKWTSKALDRATSGKRPRDERHMKGAEKCTLIKK